MPFTLPLWHARAELWQIAIAFWPNWKKPVRWQLKRISHRPRYQQRSERRRVLGLIIDRREVGDVGAFDGFTDEQLVEEAAKRARELGIAGPRLVEDDNNKSR